MRTLALAVTAAALLTVTACGSSNDGSPAAGSPAASDTTTGMGGMSMDHTPDANTPGAALASTLKDAEAYAVGLEQTFAMSSYPKDLAGAVAAAKKLDLSLSAGNTIAGYQFDPSDTEFRLCVQNTSGSWATYDTKPMAMRESGKTGGCR